VAQRRGRRSQHRVPNLGAAVRTGRPSRLGGGDIQARAGPSAAGPAWGDGGQSVPGVAAYAAVSRGRARAGARGRGRNDIVRRVEPEARVPVFGVLYHGKKFSAVHRGMLGRSKASGKSGRYLSVLNWASEYGLSLDTCGREWRFVTPRSA